MENNSKNGSQPSAYDPLLAIKTYLADANPPDPAFRNYLMNRLGDQLIWYDGKSTRIKNNWVKRRIATIVLSALIPFAVGYIGAEGNTEQFNTLLKVFVGAAGVLIAIMEALNSLFKSQELYIDYRATAEQLKQEFSFFLGKAGDYAGDPGLDAPKLVAKLENIMASQNSKWMEVVMRNEEAAQSDAIQRKVEEKTRVVQGSSRSTVQPTPAAGADYESAALPPITTDETYTEVVTTTTEVLTNVPAPSGTPPADGLPAAETAQAGSAPTPVPPASAPDVVQAPDDL
ncbi:MAG TPA: DUF4231 domain-containing protein [Saprospiraceae bacterium]|nr:DUF4231 domain-containing protein [Saprospiraceae bacterium]HND87991.1 DUF4231 domain-containing protein [Saprospiraceae bacterium]